MKTSSLVVSGKYSNQFLNLRACLFGCRVLEIMKLILVSQFILSTCHIIREHFFQIVFLFLLGIKSNKKVKSPRRLSYQLFWIIYSNTSKILILLRSLIWTYPGTNSHSMKSVLRKSSEGIVKCNFNRLIHHYVSSFNTSLIYDAKTGNWQLVLIIITTLLLLLLLLFCYQHYHF